MLRAVRVALSLVLLLVPILPALAQSGALWQRYTNHQYGYSVDVPFGLFVAGAGALRSNGVTLTSTTDSGQIQIYGGSNAQHADPAKLAAALAGAERVKEVTYRTGGRNWLVLSGYYRPAQDDAGGRVIFYTKLMFSADGCSISAFEISYPASEKLKYDPLIVHMERTLTPPARNQQRDCRAAG